MSMYKRYRTNPDIEKTGVEIDYGDFRVRVARAGGSNVKFQKVFERETRPFRKQIQADVLDVEISKRIQRTVYAEAVVLDWEVKLGEDNWQHGIELPDGSIGPFTVDNVKLAFEELPDLFRDIMEQANSAFLFRDELHEDDSKN